MFKANLALLSIVLVCGCATVAPQTDRKAELGPVREALRCYRDCLKQTVKPYFDIKTKAKVIADAAAIKCEPKLNDYKFAVREFFAEGLNPAIDGYNKILLSKPESHANRVRENGKRATIARVLEARKLMENPKQ